MRLLNGGAMGEQGLKTSACQPNINRRSAGERES